MNTITKKIPYVYPRYFQKSKIFLFPLIKIPFGSHPVNMESYFSMEEHFQHDKVFITVHYFLNEKNENCKNKKITFERFTQEILKANKRFVSIKNIGANVVECLFDLSEYREDVLLFLEGKYSCMSENTKKIVANYFAKTHPNHPFVESFVYPELYHKSYAEHLDVNVELLKEVVELCDKPDFNKEKPSFGQPNLN
jgi:hypothetical protein